MSRSQDPDRNPNNDPDGHGPVDGFTLRQFWKMCDAHMSDLIPLAQADIEKSFVYDRKFGFFYVPFGMHQTAMSLLLAFHHGVEDGIDVSEKLGLKNSYETADHWLEKIPGTAFRSSQGKKVNVGRRGNLNALELRRFGAVEYLFNDFS